MTDDVSTSNSLVDLAARIKAEHEAVSAALKESVRHAIVAGELLIEAKGKLAHGQWLPWIQDHCTISERTAQLYMRVAKNRVEIENQIRNDDCGFDLTLNEAAALLMLSSDVRKVLDFAKQAEGLSGEALVDFCIANNVGVIYRVEYLLQRPFQNVDEWLGPAGDLWLGARYRSNSRRPGPPSGARLATKPSPRSRRSIWSSSLASMRTRPPDGSNRTSASADAQRGDHDRPRRPRRPYL
jgi:hypothetical protein